MYHWCFSLSWRYCPLYPVWSHPLRRIRSTRIQTWWRRRRAGWILTIFYRHLTGRTWGGRFSTLLSFWSVCWPLRCWWEPRLPMCWTALSSRETVWSAICSCLQRFCRVSPCRSQYTGSWMLWILSIPCRAILLWCAVRTSLPSIFTSSFSRISACRWMNRLSLTGRPTLRFTIRFFCPCFVRPSWRRVS